MMTYKTSHANPIKLTDIRAIGKFTKFEFSTPDGYSAPQRRAQDPEKDTSGSRYFVGKIVEVYDDQVSGDKIMYSCKMEFNSECKGWHYGWVSSRFTSCATHVFTVSLYIPADRDVDNVPLAHMRKIGAFNSPPFGVASLRRKSDKSAGPIKASALDRDSPLTSTQSHSDDASVHSSVFYGYAARAMSATDNSTNPLTWLSNSGMSFPLPRHQPSLTRLCRRRTAAIAPLPTLNQQHCTSVPVY